MKKEKLLEDKTIRSFMKIAEEGAYVPSSTNFLVGGAVVDILEGRCPKDYDFKMGDTLLYKFLEAGYKFVCESNTATTYRKGGTIIQVLKTELKDFDFKISQSKLSMGKGFELTVDKASFESKQLIPTNLKNRKNCLSSLQRIPHWIKKGYSIHDITYWSLLGIVGKDSKVGENHES